MTLLLLFQSAPVAQPRILGGISGRPMRNISVKKERRFKKISNHEQIAFRTKFKTTMKNDTILHHLFLTKTNEDIDFISIEDSSKSKFIEALAIGMVFDDDLE